MCVCVCVCVCVCLSVCMRSFDVLRTTDRHDNKLGVFKSVSVCKFVCVSVCASDIAHR